MKKIILFFILLSLLSFTSVKAEEIQTTFVCPDEPAIHMTFNIPENVDGVLKYYPIRLDLNGTAKTSSGATMPINIHMNLEELRDIKFTPQEIYAKIIDIDIKDIFAQYYQTAAGINVKE